MDHSLWPTRNWWIFKNGSGSGNVDAGDQIELVNVGLGQIKINDFYCPHSGTPHGNHWKGVICNGSSDTANGSTLISMLTFKITSLKPASLEQLSFTLPVAIPKPKEEEPDPGPAGASWTAEEGGTGRPPKSTPGGGDAQRGGRGGRRPRRPGR